MWYSQRNETKHSAATDFGRTLCRVTQRIVARGQAGPQHEGMEVFYWPQNKRDTLYECDMTSQRQSVGISFCPFRSHEMPPSFRLQKKKSAIQWRVLVSVCLEKFERFTEPETPLLAQTPNTACSQVIQHGRLQQSLNTRPSVLVHVWILPMSRVTDAVS